MRADKTREKGKRKAMTTGKVAAKRGDAKRAMSTTGIEKVCQTRAWGGGKVSPWGSGGGEKGTPGRSGK